MRQQCHPCGYRTKKNIHVVALSIPLLCCVRRYCRRIIPDRRLPRRPSQLRFGASSISRTRSSKYVGWLLGSSIGPLSLYYDRHDVLAVLRAKGDGGVERELRTLSRNLSWRRNCRPRALRSSSCSVAAVSVLKRASTALPSTSWNW